MDSPYRFRPVTAADLPLLREWRSRPHVRSWWGPPDDEDPAEALADPDTAAWIVVHGGRPFAYAQDYDLRAGADHPFARLPAGSRGIDQLIGEPDMIGKGHGSAFVRAHCDRLFAGGAPAIGTDPHPDNVRAIRAYEKAGFAAGAGPVETRWGLALLMERWADPAPGDGAAVALFSYGTLRQENVQLATFRRRLEGRPDALPGFVLSPMAITDPHVIATSGSAVHTIARASGDPADLIPGLVFRVTPAELEAADRYEAGPIMRIEVALSSGTRAFVYVARGG